ncbi:MAG: alpha/beta fold hydrolase [Acidobacteria bacterium]|nr:alpha/beta fold hydrolase [Acidobacteriota bacterium]
MSGAIRTPEERFIAVSDYDWPPNYTENLPGYEGLRMHLVDEGPARSPQVYLCLHGEPTWGYLYRKMIPVFLEAGGRVVVPDMFGFGRSDKPVDDDAYDWEFHRGSLLALIEQRNLRGITLVCQDWGGLLGLTLPMAMPDRFDRILVMNTALGTGDYEPTPGFLAWRQFVRDQPHFDIPDLMQRACPSLSDAEAAAYGAPFPDATYRAGVRRFPEMVPTDPAADGAALSREARDWLSRQWSGQSFAAVGAQDPVLGVAVMEQVASAIRGCPAPVVFEELGHFVQEGGDAVARAALTAWGDLEPDASS